MHPSPAVAAARHFLNVVWNGDAPTDDALTEALDGLLIAYHGTPDANPASDLEAPRQDGASLYREVQNRFPEYGFYPVAEPMDRIDQELGMADAIDDLADLTLDMREVVWLADNVGLDDAHWAFRLLYFHWGEHARRLATYLFAHRR